MEHPSSWLLLLGGFAETMAPFRPLPQEILAVIQLPAVWPNQLEISMVAAPHHQGSGELMVGGWRVPVR